VTVELIQLRSDVVDRAAQVRVVNAGEGDLVIRELEIVDPRFETPILREKRARVPSGRTLDMRITLPPVACDADATSDGATRRCYEAPRRGSLIPWSSDDVATRAARRS